MAHTSFPVSFKIERYYDKYYEGVEYNLSASDPEALTLEEVLNLAEPETRKLWDEMKFSYTSMAGHSLLRAEISKLHGVSPSQVLEIIPIEGIYIAMQCLVRYLKSKHNLEQLHVVTTYPVYQSLQENLKLLDCDVTDWKIRTTPEKWYFDVKDLRSVLKENTKILVVNFPHNPTGAMLTSAEWNELIQICKDRGIFLFSDEMYRLTNLDGSVPLTSACALYKDSISLFGLSKTLALPALRCGWLCTQNAEILGMMQRFKDYTSVCGTLPSEILGIIALRKLNNIVSRTVRICNDNLKLLDEFFKKYPKLFVWRRPNACTTGFLEIQGWLLHLGSGGATGFCEVLAKETGILLLPSSIYSYEPDNYVRLGFGRENLAFALQKVEYFIENFKH